jgi:glycosyltransferase involved in cell wall biosynthesis
MVPGGAQREVLDLMSRINRAHFHVSLSCHPVGAWVRNAAALADAFYPMPALVRPVAPLTDTRAMVGLTRLMRRRPFDIVHTRTSKAGIVGRLAAMAGRLPVIVHTPHGSVYHRSFLSPWAQQYIAAVERVVGRHTDRIITKSAHEAAEYVRLRIAPSAKFQTIRSGLDQARIIASESRPRGDIRGNLGCSDGRPLILYPARFVPEKDHRSFLRAFGKVLARMPDAVAVLAGEGPLRRESEAEAGHLIDAGALVSLGFRDDVPDLMRAADVCISASLTEGLPIMVAEALAVGCPVVSTDAGGTREVLRHRETGLLVPPGATQALADAIMAALQDPHLARRLGESGRRLVGSMFGVQNMVASTMALYRELWETHQERSRWQRGREAEPRRRARPSG